uniref:Aquaporin n=1 Tax=Alexandrium andersonii TaxID=327968 RepID=A0A7S2MRS3_9DINO
MAYSLGRYSGGQINCAVTLALWVKNLLTWEQALANFVAQMLGSVTGAALLCIIFPKSKDKTGGLGTNGVQDGFHPVGVLLAEIVMTFVLVTTVFESGLQTAPASGIAVIPIGFAVFLAHLVLIPIDGCSINPTRSFGPALIATLRDGKVDYFTDMWIFWIGPLLGALAAAGVHELFLRSV